MEKEFVTYEQALALKELRFDDECMGYFKDREFKYCLEDELVKNSLMSNSNSPIFYTTRPLKSQVFRWFREKYNITAEICISSIRRNDVNKWMFSITFLKTNLYTYSEITYNTYEEAENACIDNLIEIDKQENNG